MSLPKNSHFELITTADGSHSLYVTELDETYHSRHGAVQESMHVFIEMGLRFKALTQTKTAILEVGFGTGLNALLTAKEAIGNGHQIDYTTLETFPLNQPLVDQLNYAQSDEKLQLLFRDIHGATWNEAVVINENFRLEKVQQPLQQFRAVNQFDLVYYDAFGPPRQPEMWEQAIFNLLFVMLKPAGILVTYCAKGQVRRNMLAAGFEVERLQGPPGKREMLRATKRQTI
jgi:tRNA U34 5-methylaminomethyl-2-thiouridine-forming methyltransferase MnmC